MEAPLPTKEEQDEILRTRPGDQLWEKIRPDVERLGNQTKQFSQHLVDIVVRDSAWDKALAGTLDHFGAVLEYQAQEDGSVTPTFDGKILMNIFGRFSRFKACVDFAKALGLEGEALAMALRAEADRIWDKPRAMQPAPQAQQTPVAPELVQALQGISSYMRDRK